jgi:ABC-type multidrug transport system ATPase subunit
VSEVLQIQGLKVRYDNDDEPVLRGVDLSLEREKVVIVGPNGSGKSTLFKAVLGLAPVSGGTVKVDGTDVKEVRGETGVSTNMAEVYKLVYLPTEDVVSMFAALKGGSLQRTIKMLDEFELQPILGKRLHELSTGQQKMFGNIMAVSFAPKLVLLDEPFDNVDESRRRRFIEILKGLDAGVVIITHELNLLKRLEGWSLYFMLDGKLWGKFSASQLDRLYVTRGEAKDALAVMETSLGTLSVTLDHGDIPVQTATSLNSILEQV